MPRSHSGLAAEVGVETLERIANKWQTHFWRLFPWRITVRESCGGSCLQMSGIVSLVDFIGREVSGIDIRA